MPGGARGNGGRDAETEPHQQRAMATHTHTHTQRAMAKITVVKQTPSNHQMHATSARPSSSSTNKVYIFPLGVFAPPDPPFKLAAVAASAGQLRTFKPSRPLSRPLGGVGST